MLEATDLVVLLPRHVAEVFQGWFPDLRIAELPWPGQSTPVSLYTRREASLTPAQRWFRALVLRAVAEALVAGGSPVKTCQAMAPRENTS